VREALLRFVGTGGLGALMATRRALRRDVRELAAQVAWDESIDFDFELVVHPSRIAMWAKSFPNARALNVMHRMAEALAVQFATTAGGLRNLQSLTLCECRLRDAGMVSLALALKEAADGHRLVKLSVSRDEIGDAGAIELRRHWPRPQRPRQQRRRQRRRQRRQQRRQWGCNFLPALLRWARP
jgi:hypothetical protein